MIIVHGTIPIRADQRDEALELARRMEDASRLEAGCISYAFFVGLSDPNTLMLFQEWESADALQQHFETEHMERFLEALPGIVNGEIHTRRYAVEVDGVDDADEGLPEEDGSATGVSTIEPRGKPPIIH
ncbi:MAG: putative quinol monooxygenase [Pseudomonadales bacterium]|jgi:quinol monooxygenase YgiN|nr:putative quinol monooxygenase [Pseudomonadales bacterium]